MKDSTDPHLSDWTGVLGASVGWRLYSTEKIWYRRIGPYITPFLPSSTSFASSLYHERYEKRSRLLAGHLDDELTEYNMEERRSGMHEVSDDYYISHEHPEYNVFIEWSYEIDLDNLVFHINHTPMFRLDCMPSSDDFCRFISWDHYGERFYAENMPERHRYEANWHPSPPEISDEQLEAYKRLEATITGKGDISPLAMSIVSRTRIRLLEALVVVQVPDTVGTQHLL